MLSIKEKKTPVAQKQTFPGHLLPRILAVFLLSEDLHVTSLLTLSVALFSSHLFPPGCCTTPWFPAAEGQPPSFAQTCTCSLVTQLLSSPSCSLLASAQGHLPLPEGRLLETLAVVNSHWPVL